MLLKSGKYVKKTSSILLCSYKCTLQLIVLKWLNSDLLEPLKSCLDPLRELWDLLHEDVRSRYSRGLAQGFPTLSEGKGGLPLFHLLGVASTLGLDLLQGAALGTRLEGGPPWALHRSTLCGIYYGR